jgi:pimeloyl-ACP methyl ester carboxylesterase
VITETDLELDDGRTLHVYDTGPADAALAVFWHHGTPNTGAPPEPLFPAAAQRGFRWVSCDRPAYGGSTPQPGRDIAAGAGDIAAAADALGIKTFAVMGSSGGGPHALACAALLPDRVHAVVSQSAPAPFSADGLDWFAGMAAGGEAELRAAVAGREALAARLAAGEFDPDAFTPEDLAALAGSWSWLGHIAGQALEAGLDGMIDDDLALVAPWGFDPAQIRQPVLLLHGRRDRMVPSSHGTWLARRCPNAELWLRPADGHVSILASSAGQALDWLSEYA